jgi:hypothetical protein
MVTMPKLLSAMANLAAAGLRRKSRQSLGTAEVDDDAGLLDSGDGPR